MRDLGYRAAFYGMVLVAAPPGTPEKLPASEQHLGPLAFCWIQKQEEDSQHVVRFADAKRVSLMGWRATRRVALGRPELIM